MISRAFTGYNRGVSGLEDFNQAERPSVSVVIPVYNSGQALSELIQRLMPVLAAVTFESEVILVNDGSRDNSWAEVESLVRTVPGVRGIDLTRNFGQHNALLAGIRTARYDLVVTMDDDLQHPPEEIPKLLAAMTEGVDLVYGVAAEEEHGFWRNASSRLAKAAMASSMGASTAKIVSAFRLFRTDLRDSFETTADPFVSIDVLLSWVTGRVASADVQMEARRYGESNYTFRRLVRHAVNMATGYSTIPLRLVSWVGLGFALFGVVVFLYVIAVFVIEGGSVPGFPFLAAMIALLSGAQLFALGIIGEYLGRMHFRSMQRPAYAIRMEIGAEPASQGSTSRISKK